uniref:glycosyltransferase family 2 protein n=1 Tax=Eubacterium sp. TaxID=142586 RepID=UPI00402614F8
MPRFSIIVPVYNVEEYLSECVESVVSQTFTDWELILVDDGSPDNCPRFCDEWALKDQRIKSIHKANGGASSARNKGLEVSAGEYVLFLDGDDFYNDKNTLKTFDEKLTASDTDVLIFGCTDFNMNTGETVVSRTGYDIDLIEQGDYFHTMHYLLSNKMIPGGPTIFCFKKSIAVDNSVSFKEGIQDEDYDFVLSIFTSCKSISAIDDPFYSYRKGRADSVTGSASIKMIY